MPVTTHVRRKRDLYQPPLPGTTDPRPAPAARRSSAAGAPDWRLDEKTRRAGRQGVAAARAALAGAGGSGDGRQANAA